MKIFIRIRNNSLPDRQDEGIKFMSFRHKFIYKLFSLSFVLISVSLVRPIIIYNAPIRTNDYFKTINGIKRENRTVVFKNNMLLDGILISGMTYIEAYDLFRTRMDKIKNDIFLHLVINDENYTLTADDVAWNSDTFELLRRLWYYSLIPLEEDEKNEFEFYSGFDYKIENLNSKIENIISDIKQPSIPDGIPPNPDFDCNERRFYYSDTQLAFFMYEIDPIKIKAEILDSMESVIRTAVLNSSEIKTVPAYTLDIDLKKIEFILEDPIEYGWDITQYGIIGTYMTKTAENANRNENIRLACEAISGAKLSPGDIFSFWDLVGQTTSEKGYRVSGIFQNGRPAQGIGGGICQVSTTIYNVVLNTGLEVVERKPHSLPVDYVPRGRDATVSYPSVDFKFRNSTENDIYIMIDYINNELNVSFYGKLQKDDEFGFPQA